MERNQMMRIIRRKEVEKLTGLARSTIYLRIQKGTFPKPIKLGEYTSGWIEEEINQWIMQQIAASRQEKVNSNE